MGGNQSNQNNQNQEGNSQAESAELYKHALTGNLTEVEKLLKTASQVVVNGQENEVGLLMLHNFLSNIIITRICTYTEQRHGVDGCDS